MAKLRLAMGCVGVLACGSAGAGPSPYGRLDALEPASRGDRVLAYRLIAYQEAEHAALPYDLVDAVMKIESDYRPDRVGDVGEIGLMQVRPETAAQLGFRGDAAALADPATNIHYGTTYLGRAWRLAGGNVCRTLMKYRAGHGEETMSELSATYCARARVHLAAMRSPLAATIKPADLVAEAPSPGVAVPPSAGYGFWARLEARVRKIDARLEAKWRRVAAR